MIRYRAVIAAAAIISIVALVLLGILFFTFGSGRMAYESHKRSDEILRAWKSRGDLDRIVAVATDNMEEKRNYQGPFPFPIPFGDEVTYVSVDKDRYGIEYGGGHHHYGIIIFRNENAADDEMRPSPNPGTYTRVHSRIVFYDE